MNVPSVLPPLFLFATVVAQTTPTIPVRNVTEEGVSLSLAVSIPGYQLTQTIYESNLVYRSVQSYQALLLRPDSGIGSNSMAPMARNLSVRLSGIGVPSPELADRQSFAANRGSDYTTAIRDRRIDFPAATQRPSPAPFLVALPFDQPFSAINIAHLLVEIETRPESGAVTAWHPDAAVDFGFDWTILTSVQGAGCPAGGVFFSADYSGGISNPGGELRTTISMPRVVGQPFTHPAIAVVGTSLTRWGPFPLPLSLDGFGAPGCSIYTDALQTYVGSTGGGRAENFHWRLPVPRNFGLLGQQLHAQSFIVDPAANALGLRASPVATFTFSSPPDPYRMLTMRTLTPQSDRPLSVEPNIGLVLGVQ
ncbi:MAG: hypothetical protein AB7I19_05305 [Planctomycetota bacterium]